MKELTTLNRVHLKDYDVYVNQYLDYAQIQQIVNSIKYLEDWSVRMTNIDMLILLHTTDIEKENLEKYSHEYLLQTGLIQEVKKNIKNLGQLYEAIEWTEGKNKMQRIFTSLAGQLEKISELSKDYLDKELKKNGKPSNK